MWLSTVSEFKSKPFRDLKAKELILIKCNASVEVQQWWYDKKDKIYHLIDYSISSQANSSPLKDSCQTQKQCINAEKQQSNHRYCRS